MKSPMPPSFSFESTHIYPNIFPMIGKRIQVQWEMSDGTLQWFYGTVQSRTLDGSEAVIVYDDGESYLLDVYGEIEWRPIDMDAAPAAETQRIERTIASSGSSDTSIRDNKIVTNPVKSNDSSNIFFSSKPKSVLSLRSLLRKVTGGSSKKFSPEKKQMTHTKTQQGHISALPRPSFSFGREASQRNTSLGTTVSIPQLSDEDSCIVSSKDSFIGKRKLEEQMTLDQHCPKKKQKKPDKKLIAKEGKERVFTLIQEQVLWNAAENSSYVCKGRLPLPVKVPSRALTFCDLGIQNRELMAMMPNFS